MNQSSTVIMVPWKDSNHDPFVRPGSFAHFGGQRRGQSFRNTVELVQHSERLRYRRYWLAEHHNMPEIASAATAVLIAPVAAATSTAASAPGESCRRIMPAADRGTVWHSGARYPWR